MKTAKGSLRRGNTGKQLQGLRDMLWLIEFRSWSWRLLGEELEALPRDSFEIRPRRPFTSKLLGAR